MTNSLSALQLDVPSDVRELLQQQMLSWQRGTRLPIETIIVKAKPEHRTVAARVLIKQEIVLREQAGEVPRIDEYISRFPECADSLPREWHGEHEMTMHTMAVGGGEPNSDPSFSGDMNYERTFAEGALTPTGIEAESKSSIQKELHEALHSDSGPTRSNIRRKDDPVNRMIGMYRLDKKLGQGGMGAVFKAVHTKLDKIVAIKIMSRHGILDDSAVERFEREMRAVGRIEHPNVVRAMDAGEADGFHFLVMEYVEGQDVSQAIKTGGPFPLGQACEIIRQSALGLHEAHALGLVHRDIKPSNLFLTKKGVVKILDLGLARLSEGQINNPELTQSGLCMGTPDYMAPEQWVSARDVDGRSDFYALGCTLFHLLVGHPPFGTKEHLSLGNKVLAHTSGVVPDIRLMCADFPEDLKPVLDRMLAKDRDKRYATGVELAQALQPFCSPLPGFESSSTNEASAVPAPVFRKPESGGFKRFLGYWIAGTAVVLLGAFIIIKITDKYGRVTEVKVPADSSVNLQVVDDAGNPTDKTVSIHGDTGTEKSTTTGNSSTKKPVKPELAAVTVRPVPVIEVPDVADHSKGGPRNGRNPGAGDVFPFDLTDFPDAPELPEFTTSPNAAPKRTPSTVVALAPMKPTQPAPPPEKFVVAVPLKLPASAEVVANQQAAWARDLKRPTNQANTLGMPFVLVPPGSFVMGGTAGKVSAGAVESGPVNSQTVASENPQHHVILSRPFAIGQHEVTVGQFRQFIAATHYKTIAERESATGLALGEGLSQKKWVRQPKYSWQFAGELAVDEEQPVTNVSWYDAVAFCEWLSQKEGVTYRLPTEAEWEYVARAGAGSAVFGSAESLELIKQGANLADASGLREFGGVGLIAQSVPWDDTFATRSPIGRLAPNALGLQDLSGNASEWCGDRYGAEYYKNSPLENPRGPNSGGFRVVRGASWQSTAADCRPEMRGFALPNQSQLHIGFRMVQELPTAAEANAAKAPLTPTQRDFDIAEWVMQLGGKVRIAINGMPANEISKVRELPKVAPGNSYSVYSVSLAETGISDLGLTRLQPLSGLMELDLSGNPITDQGLEGLNSFRLIQKLDLSRTQVTGAGLIHLNANKKLAELDLSYCPVTDTSISQIKAMTSLSIVRLNSTAVTDKTLELLKPLAGLKELSLIDTRVTGSGLVHLKRLANLTALDLSETPLEDKSLTGLADLKTLRQLRLNWSTVGELGLTNLQESYTLLEVGLRGTVTADYNADMLSKLKAIRKLDLRETEVPESSVKEVAKSLKTTVQASIGDVNARVTSLCLSVGGKVVIAASRDAEELQTLTSLADLPTTTFEVREIHLTGLPVRNGVLLMVPKLNGLKVLNLNGTRIDDIGLALIAKAPKLEDLKLEGTSITEQGLGQLTAIKTLKSVSLRDNRIPNGKVTELRAKLSGVEVN